jgi:hypothetical protein
LSYYQALRRNFWLFGAVGTNIDLAAMQDVHYDYRANQNEFDAARNQVNLEVTPFNNVSFSLGVEKRLKHFDFQFSPTIMKHFQDVSYTRKNLSFGGQFSVFYRFK